MAKLCKSFKFISRGFNQFFKNPRHLIILPSEGKIKAWGLRRFSLNIRAKYGKRPRIFSFRYDPINTTTTAIQTGISTYLRNYTKGIFISDAQDYFFKLHKLVAPHPTDEVGYTSLGLFFFILPSYFQNKIGPRDARVSPHLASSALLLLLFCVLGESLRSNTRILFTQGSFSQFLNFSREIKIFATFTVLSKNFANL